MSQIASTACVKGLNTVISDKIVQLIFFRRSISDMSIHSHTISNDQDTSANTEDLDHELEAMGRNLERIEQSVGDPTQSYLP